MKRTKITARVATPTSSVTPCGRATFSAAASVGASAQSAEVATGNPRPTGEGKGVVNTPRTVKPGEKIVVEAMRAEELERLENKLERLREVLQERDTEIDRLKYVINLKDEQIKAQQTAPRLILEANEKEIEQLKAALKNELIPLTAQKMPWHNFREDPPQPRQLIAMADYSRIARRWTYWATRLERDAIEFWKSMDSDVRWAPLPEVLVGDEEPEVLP